MKCLKAYFILMFYPYFIKKDRKAKMKNKKYKKNNGLQKAVRLVFYKCLSVFKMLFAFSFLLCKSFSTNVCKFCNHLITEITVNRIKQE